MESTNNEYNNPILSVVMFAVSMLYHHLGEALDIYFLGVDFVIKTGTGIIVCVTLYKMYKKWKR